MKKTKEQINKENESRKAFAKRIKSLSNKDAIYSLRFENSHVMENGKAYINVDLTKVESPFSVYSYENRLDPEIFNYIEQEADFLSVDIPLVVNFDDGGKYDDELKSKIARAVVRHYRLIYEDRRAGLSRNLRFALFTLMLGIIFQVAFVLLVIFLGDKVVNPVLFEIFEIVSWVFTWEFVDRIALSGSRKRWKVFSAGQLALLEITFGEPKKHN